MPLPLHLLALAVVFFPATICYWTLKPRIGKFLLPLVVMALALAVLISEFLGGGSARTVIRFFAYFILVSGFSLLSPRKNRDRLLLITLWTGLILMVVSLVGYVVGNLILPQGDGIRPFFYSSPHPVFGGFPRLSGTMGAHPQSWGEYCVLLLCLACLCLDKLAPRHRRLSWITAGLACTSLLLTFSQAWIGGMWIGVWLFINGSPRIRPLRPVILAIAILATIAVSWVVNVGLPSSHRSREIHQGEPCGPSDSGHFVARVEFREGVHLCHFQWHDWPYSHRLTTYLQAKSTAVEAIRRHPFLGTGLSRYPAFADGYFAATLGGGLPNGTNYPQPHSTWLGIPARWGLLATAAWMGLVFLLFWFRPTPIRPESILFVTVVAFLFLGLDWSVEDSIFFWTLIGWYAPPVLE